MAQHIYFVHYEIIYDYADNFSTCMNMAGVNSE